MKRLLLILAACGGGSFDPPDNDFPPFKGSDAEIDTAGDGGIYSGCQILTQTGCNTGEKCTWVLSTDDTETDPGIGADACAPNGTHAVGASCTFAKVAQGGYDDCVGGAICIDGTCRAICDLNGGAPMCSSGTACVAHGGIFANQGATETTAGSCDPLCDPLADNDFDGSGTRFTKSGSACGSDPTVGCYGAVSSAHTSSFTCSRPYTGTELLTHRSTVPANLVANNSCMPGYHVATMFLDDTGTLDAMCLAWCKPGDAYAGNPNANAPNGVAPHRCNTDDALGAFGVAASDTQNGEHCWYSWAFELDDQNAWHPSPTSDSLGICIDHTKYKYDSDGNGSADAVFPPCASLPLTAPSDQLTAASFGCVQSSLANLTKAPHRHFVPMPELRY